MKVSYIVLGLQKSIKLSNRVWMVLTWHLGSKLIAACIHIAAVEGLLPWWCLSCNLDKSLQSLYLSGNQWIHFSRNDFASSQFSSRRPCWRTVKYIPELSISVPTSSWRTAWVKVTSRHFRPRAQRASSPWREAGCSCELFQYTNIGRIKDWKSENLSIYLIKDNSFVHHHVINPFRHIIFCKIFYNKWPNIRLKFPTFEREKLWLHLCLQTYKPPSPKQRESVNYLCHWCWPLGLCHKLSEFNNTLKHQKHYHIP